jgi:TolB-like protein/tetratricopeptide (TPR) repeat protein
MTALLAQLVSAPDETGGAVERLLLPGTTIGRFEILRVIDRGAFGVVYEARDCDLGRSVALKIVRPARSELDEATLSQEAEAVARLSHPNLVTLFEVGRSEHGAHLVFELLRGKTLQQRLGEGPLPLAEAIRIGVEVARGLAHAHAEGVVHRDLKPSNVYLCEQGGVKILDFGMAHAFGRKRISGGTPAYMAPEQWVDAPEDERTDVFALGVILHRMLSGEYPYPEDGGRWSSGDASAPRLHVPGTPALGPIVGRMLEKAPTSRPRDGAAVLSALEPIEWELRRRPPGDASPSRAPTGKASLRELLGELRRRRVFGAVGAYALLAFVILQVQEPVAQALDLPDWSLRAVVLALATGFPAVFVLAWIFDVRSGRLERTLPAPGAIGSPAVVARQFHGMRLVALLLGLAAVAAAPGLVYFFVWPGALPVARHEPPPGVAPLAPSVAVLPFTDMSPQQDQDFLADGLAEEILNALAQVEGMKVAGRTSSFTFKGKGEDLRIIGQRLGVATILEGSVRKSGNRIRVTAELVKAADGFHLWSRTFDGDVGDILAVQDEIARAVVEALQVRLLPGRSISVRARQTTSPDAFEQYLRGELFLTRYRLRETRLAQTAFEKAIALDPGYGLAWSELSAALGLLSDWAEPVDRPELHRRALEAADKGVELTPTLSDGWARRAGLRMQIRRDWTGALSDIDRSLALNPNDVVATEARARLLAARGQLPEAIAAGRRVVELDPLSLGGWLRLHTFHAAAGQADLARQDLDQASVIAPSSYQVVDLRAWAELEAGRPASALALVQQPEVPEDSRFALAAIAFHALGQEEDSRRALDALVKGYAQTEAYQIAEVHAWRGEKDLAVEWLERAFRQDDGGLVGVLPWVRPVKWNPAFRELRGAPRFAALLADLRLPVD